MEATITGILFDYGGVIAEEGFAEGLAAIARRHGLEPRWLLHQAVDAVYDSGYVVGRGSEADFWKLLCDRTGLAEPLEQARAEVLNRFRLRPGMLALVDEVRERGYKTALLTDQTDWLDTLDQRDHFLDHFDRVFNSYRLGLGKRNPRLFRMVACRMGAEPNQLLFIDDQPGNLERAAGVGLQTLRFESESQCRQALAERGLLSA